MPCTKMIKRILCFLCITGSLLLACSCSSKEAEQGKPSEEANQQVFETAYRVDDNWTSKTVKSFSNLADSREKTYQYENYQFRVCFSAENGGDLEKAMEQALSDDILVEDPKAAEVTEERELQIGDLQAKQRTYSWEITGTSSQVPQKAGETGHFITTTFKTDMGNYTLNGVCYGENAYAEMNREYQKLLDSVALTDQEDPEVFAANVGQAGGFVFSLPNWESRTELKNGTVLYRTDEMAILQARKMEHEKMDQALMEQTVKEMLLPALPEGDKAAVSLTKQKNLASAVGNAVEGELVLSLPQGKEKDPYRLTIRAVFVQDKNGKAQWCFSAPYEEAYNYGPVLNSLTYAETVEDKVDGLWENKLNYAGDNSKVSQLLEETDFKECGPYTIELDTKQEPYGLAICYTKPVKNFNFILFDSEAVFLLGLIENLDYVEIRSSGDTKKYTCDDANGILKYNVKKLAKDKAALMRYALTRISYNQSLKTDERLKQADDGE